MLSTVMGISLRELSRRRLALVSIFLLPLVFYLARIDQYWQALRFLSIGVGWAVATLSLFSYIDSRSLDRRLSAVGASPSRLFLGKQLALLTVGGGVAAAYFVLVLLTQRDLPRVFFAALLLATSVLISVPLGALVSIVIDRHLEGALALLPVLALQLLVDPDDWFALLLPLWSTRELTTYVVEGGNADKVVDGMTHFAGTFALFLAAAWVINVVRLRPVRIRAPLDGDDNPETKTTREHGRDDTSS